MKKYKPKRERKGRDKRKKSHSPDKKAPNLLARVSVISFILIIIGLGILTYRLLNGSDYFSIRTSRIDWLSEPIKRGPYKDLYYTGINQNIFTFDTSSATSRILGEHPELKDLKIVRDFPDRLTLRISPRVPVAQVGDRNFFLVDGEGVILCQPQESIREGLPIVTGISWNLFRKVGNRDDSLRMVRALSLLEAVEETDFTDDHTLSKIDASDYKNLSFLIENGLEVKIGHSNFSKRLGTLEWTLGSIEVDKDRIRYIDLRFDDVVLGTK